MVCINDGAPKGISINYVLDVLEGIEFIIFDEACVKYKCVWLMCINNRQDSGNKVANPR